MAMQSLVVFHMNGCPHCAAVTGPQSACRGLEDLVDLYEIEAADPLTRAVGVSSFPCVMLVNPLFAFGPYEGPRDQASIRAYVLRKMAQTTAYLDDRGV